MEDTKTPFDDVTFEVGDDPDSPPTDEEEADEQDKSTNEQSEEETQDQEKEEVQEEETQEDVQDQQEESEEEDADEVEEEEESVSVIDALKSQTGIDTENDYDDNLEGAAQYINDAAQKQAEEQVNQVIQSMPDDVQTYMQYRANGGDPEEFMQTFNSNWNDTELKEDSKEQHETIVRNRLREEGWDQEDIDEAVEDYKSSGVLYNEAKRSLRRLQDIEEQQKENLVQQQEEKVQQQQQEVQEVWNEIEDTLNDTSDLNGLPVPESKKGDFYDWMSEPVDEVQGQPVSQRDRAAQEADLETLLTLDYVLYLMNDDDLSFSDVIDSKAKNKKAEDLKSLLDNSKGEDTPSSKSTTPSGDGSSNEVDTEQLPDATDLIS